MFHSNFKREPTLTFPDWNPEDFDVFQRWTYFADTSSITPSNFAAVWKIADYLFADRLRSECLKMC
jgi:hypothetical protein